MLEKKVLFEDEKIIKGKSGILFLLLDFVVLALSIYLFGAAVSGDGEARVLQIIISSLMFFSFFITLAGLKVVKPNEALVLTLFGKYYGTLREPGYYFVNPFCSAINPTIGTSLLISQTTQTTQVGQNAENVQAGKAVSLKIKTLNNERQKINDELGNPIIIGIVVIWRIVNPTKAVFNVDNYKEFITIQTDAALRNIVREYPYDVSEEEKEKSNEQSLRGSSEEIADRIREEIQQRVEVAGMEIIEARITHLSYAPEIAAAMLQRQQASAIVDARQMIVEGAVGMVEMALDKLSEREIVDLDEERKAAMVSNLLVVLCSSKDTQPIVNSGSLY